MKLEDQVCSLELAKKLKHLGVKQDSLFYWHNIDSIPSVICSHWYPEKIGDFWASAFTVSELGDMLPGSITIDNVTFYLAMTCDKIPFYEDMPKTEEVYSSDDKDGDEEADSRAKMIIYLIENDLITLKEYKNV